MDRIYKYNPNTSNKPNGRTYPQLITAKDLYIQNITVAEHDGHSDSFQVKFPNVFTHYPNDAVRVEDQKFKDWDHYKSTLWQSQLNFAVFRYARCCSHYDDFRYRHKCLVDRLLSQGYKAFRLEKSFKKFYGRYQDLIEKYRRSVNAMVSDSFPGQFPFNM